MQSAKKSWVSLHANLVNFGTCGLRVQCVDFELHGRPVSSSISGLDIKSDARLKCILIADIGTMCSQWEGLKASSLFLVPNAGVSV